MSDEQTPATTEAAAEDSSQAENEEQSFSAAANRPKNLEVVMNIPVRLSMEVGHTKMTIRSLLKLGKGSVVELARMAGEPLDVLANGTLIAKGEVVVVDDNFGIRLTDVVSPEERLQTLS